MDLLKELCETPAYPDARERLRAIMRRSWRP